MSELGQYPLQQSYQGPAEEHQSTADGQISREENPVVKREASNSDNNGMNTTRPAIALVPSLNTATTSTLPITDPHSSPRHFVPNCKALNAILEGEEVPNNAQVQPNVEGSELAKEEEVPKKKKKRSHRRPKRHKGGAKAEEEAKSKLQEAGVVEVEAEGKVFEQRIGTIAEFALPPKPTIEDAQSFVEQGEEEALMKLGQEVEVKIEKVEEMGEPTLTNVPDFIMKTQMEAEETQGAVEEEHDLITAGNHTAEYTIPNAANGNVSASKTQTMPQETHLATRKEPRDHVDVAGLMCPAAKAKRQRAVEAAEDLHLARGRAERLSMRAEEMRRELETLRARKEWDR